MRELENTTQLAATVRFRKWSDYIPVATGIAALAIALTLVLFARSQTLPFWKPLILFAIAFCCEFVDSSLGMGYGTTFTPLLIIMGYDLHTIVPVILLSEFLTGMTAGGFHHALGNAQFTLRSRDSRIAAVLVATGIFGALIAVQFLVHIPRYWVKLYFAIMITAMGLLIILNRNGSYRFSWTKIMSLGLVSAFNKGISGGGYGPLVVGGQLLSGCNAKNAVACTSLSESLVCLAGLIGFAANGMFPYPVLAVPIVAGALLSAPCASVMTRYLDNKIDLKKLVGAIVMVLGIVCLMKAL
jgi:uncharacterized membrane protein YfcA